MTTNEIDKILACIGGKVTFTYPGDEGTKLGILKDRAVFESPIDPGDIPYWSVVDLIEFKDQQEPEFIRIGYYRRKPGQHLRYGSQTAPTEPVSVWKEMLIKAAREKLWFRELLEHVMDELEKE